MSVHPKALHCGIDFGTINSSLSISLGKIPQSIPLDPQNTNPFVFKSLIYFNPQNQYFLSSDAISHYLNDLKNFPSKPLRLKYTGRFIKTFGPSTGSGVGPPIFVPEIIEVDDSGRGRLLQSLKSVLTSSSFTGTKIFEQFYSLEDLLTILLSQIKIRAESQIKHSLESVVIGRPVRYVGSSQDKTAINRMTKIAKKSGFKNIHFEFEPVGAALNYGLNVVKNQKILVFDFGGGTLDVCIMKFPEKKVIAVSGRPIGGDLLNSHLIKSKVIHYFGANTIINGKMPFPRHHFSAFNSWYQTTLQKTVKNIGNLEDLAIKSNNPALVRNLINLINNDYGFDFFRTIDQTKINLSSTAQELFDFSRPGLSIQEPISRSDFEHSIADDLQDSRQCIFDSLSLANLKPENIDQVILTGGSSQIPIFIDMITKIFTQQKLVTSDHFTAVAQGLALRAEEVFS
ncbi:MAG: Hsp70 family protein [Candidatus Shapirobacteria bacterium]|jgi:hypothetical chaperone protein